MVHILNEVKDYAIKNNVPIMMDDGIEFIVEYIKKNNIKNILEIGTAIGYSAMKMCINDTVHVTTIERDKERYDEAIKNINNNHLQNQINVIYSDAFEVELNEKYDLIFIDAAKSQYIKFFEKFKKNLDTNGTIITDNLNFHGYTKQSERIESRNLRQLVGKIRKYIEFLEKNEEFKTEFYNIGDGIGVSTWAK